MRILKPIEQELWIEEYRERDFWLRRRQDWKHGIWKRFCSGYVGWWLHLRLIYAGWHRLSILFDGLNSSGFYGHLKSFLYNAVVVDIFWGFRNWCWKKAHRLEWEERKRLGSACAQALREEAYDQETEKGK